MTIVKPKSRHKYIPLNPSYYRPDRFEAYKGKPYLRCPTCGKCSPIPLDMEFHLYYHNRWNLWGPSDYLKESTMDDGLYDEELKELEKEAIRNGRYFGFEDEDG